MTKIPEELQINYRNVTNAIVINLEPLCYYKNKNGDGADDRNRICNLRITSASLCLLSYVSVYTFLFKYENMY